MPRQKKEKFVAQFLISGRKYRETGNSILEALTNVEIPLTKVKSILTLEHGENEQSRVLPPNQMLRISSPSRLVREAALKNTSLMFDV